MTNKKILIGVTGGIACYKIADMVSLLAKTNFVKVIMTPSATEFVTPLTFQVLSKNPVYINMFDTIDKTTVEHIDLAKWADIMVIAPATANTIGKIANGICDNLLTTVCMALPEKIPVVIAPAMNTNMWMNRIVQNNIDVLYEYRALPCVPKYSILAPVEGGLACGDVGVGKLTGISEIIKTIMDIMKYIGKVNE